MIKLTEYSYEGWRNNQVRGPIYINPAHVLCVRSLCDFSDGKPKEKGSSVEMGVDNYIHVTETPLQVCEFIEDNLAKGE